MMIGMARLLVLGDDRYRGAIADRIGSASDLEVDDCDPALGDCVMYVRLEGARYAAFVFVGYDDPVTRGALAVVAERAVLVPLLERGSAKLDRLNDGYLFRLPRALGFRDEDERAFTHESFPKAATVPSELVGQDLGDQAALARLVTHAACGSWAWADFVQRVADEARGAG